MPRRESAVNRPHRVKPIQQKHGRAHAAATGGLGAGVDRRLRVYTEGRTATLWGVNHVNLEATRRLVQGILSGSEGHWRGTSAHTRLRARRVVQPTFNGDVPVGQTALRPVIITDIYYVPGRTSGARGGLGRSRSTNPIRCPGRMDSAPNL